MISVCYAWWDNCFVGIQVDPGIWTDPVQSGVDRDVCLGFEVGVPGPP
jgi:hypothetical protein